MMRHLARSRTVVDTVLIGAIWGQKLCYLLFFDYIVSSGAPVRNMEEFVRAAAVFFGGSTS